MPETFDRNELAGRIRALPLEEFGCELLGLTEHGYVVEGDRTLREQDVDAYVLERIEIAEAALPLPEPDRKGLMAKFRDGTIVRWSRGKLLTYTVLRESFGSADEYDAVRRAMSIATTEWMTLCGVAFAHDTTLDGRLEVGDDEVTFVVAGGHTTSSLVAEAFFPDDRQFGGSRDRVLRVYPAWFADAPAFDPVGVTRHELGHVLGFRHEHIRPEAPQIFGAESLDDATELTEYDPGSVMHYPIPGVRGDLSFTDLDEIGARRVYGGPDRDYLFIP